ncbi:MAG: diacylglycerol kinase family protein [Oscillospiraceae bacterium]|nr:diacylglycerol kinase family protein [Oscillospiraceae bacterium]
MAGYVLYNPLAGNGKGGEDARLLELILQEDLEFYDMTRITNYAAFLSGMEPGDYLIIAGGDGTLNRFVNDTEGLRIERQILYFPVGTGNDFAKDLSRDAYSIPRPINWYIKDLPIVEVHGKKYRFFNGVGFGIDGYCCQVGDELRKEAQEVNYTSIAVKGLLRHFDARSARITVDGETFTYEKVWIAPTMYGRYYGGGMMAAPDQRRWDKEKRLSLVIFHGAGRLRTLCIFPSIFKGRHINHKKYVAVHTGTNIKVEFDRPTPLQIDGETVPNVTSYTAFI